MLIAGRMAQVAADSLPNAVAWESRLLSALRSLGDLPTACPIDAAASQRAGVTLRKMVFERTYLAFYTFDSLVGVEVVHFRHGARQPGPREP